MFTSNRNKQDLDGAIAECRKALDIDPDYAAAHNNLGLALRDNKDLDGAIAEYRKATIFCQSVAPTAA